MMLWFSPFYKRGNRGRQAHTQPGSRAHALSHSVAAACETQVCVTRVLHVRGTSSLWVEVDAFILSFQETKEEKSSYNCPLCEKVCTTQHQLTMHIRQVCRCFCFRQLFIKRGGDFILTDEFWLFNLDVIFEEF